MVTHDARSGDGFVSFYRNYTKTWVHAVATAGLTAFGTLTIVHRWFVVLALASYVVPPIVLYLRGTSVEGADETAPTADRTAARSTTDGPADGSSAEQPADESPTDRAAPERGRLERTETEPSVAVETDLETDDASAAGATPAPADSEEGDAESSSEEAAARDDRASETVRDRSWEGVDVPTEATLRDVCVTEGGTAHAVGEDGLVLTGRPADGEGIDAWSRTLEDGPAAAGEELHGVDATADGEAVWIAGDSGAVGRLEAATGRHTDYTAPASITDNWLGVAVAGPSGDETILLINGSGAVVRGRYRDGDCAWDEPVKPGGGSSLSGIALADASVGYCCDTNDGVFETTDGGDSFDRVGLEGAGGTLENLATLGRGDCLVSADDGVVHRYGGSTWTPERVGEEAICGIDRREGETIACDADGAIYERAPTADWTQVETRAPESLLAVSVDTDGDRAVAVGEDGTVVERR